MNLFNGLRLFDSFLLRVQDQLRILLWGSFTREVFRKPKNDRNSEHINSPQRGINLVTRFEFGSLVGRERIERDPGVEDVSAVF
jgi:hypothetical protein